jgi:hypothetical protein
VIIKEYNNMNKSDNIDIPKIDVSTCSGLSIDTSTKRDWHICPRCMKRKVNKVLRRCDACGGVLLFNCDESYMEYCDNRGKDWYKWDHAIFNQTLWGWYHSTYYRETPVPKCEEY